MQKPASICLLIDGLIMDLESSIIAKRLLRYGLQNMVACNGAAWYPWCCSNCRSRVFNSLSTPIEGCCTINCIHDGLVLHDQHVVYVHMDKCDFIILNAGHNSPCFSFLFCSYYCDKRKVGIPGCLSLRVAATQIPLTIIARGSCVNNDFKEPDSVHIQSNICI